MQEVKMPTSDSWKDALIESLTDSEEAAAYLSVALEAEEFDAKVLRAVIQDIIEAHLKVNNVSKKANQYHQQIDKMLSKNAANEIYTFVSLLDALGFCIEVKSKQDSNHSQHL